MRHHRKERVSLHSLSAQREPLCFPSLPSAHSAHARLRDFALTHESRTLSVRHITTLALKRDR